MALDKILFSQFKDIKLIFVKKGSAWHCANKIVEKDGRKTSLEN